MSKGVCAVVVTFHPSDEDIANLEAIRLQVEYMVAVDNGSAFPRLTALRKACAKLNIRLMENGTNLGIAAALNLGVRWAQSKNCKWVVLFDQDSKPTGGMVYKMLTALACHPHSEKIGIMVPHYVDRRSRLPMKAVRTKAGGIFVAQTSGTLMPLAVFEHVGFFDESLFVDTVDYDFSLRAREHGWFIEECKNATLLHKPADLEVYRWFGHEVFRASNYASARRYYRTRNALWILRRHGRKHPLFCIRLNWWNLKDLMKIVAEQNRWQKWRAAVRGLAEGILARPELHCDLITEKKRSRRWHVCWWPQWR